MTLPILYSFRRCPYAMRARLALASASIPCELREVVLRDKPAELLAASPKGTVPVLVAADATVEQSLEIMRWALSRNDPEGWLDMPGEGHALIAQIDGPFKSALDRYKYASRHPETDPAQEREKAALILLDFNKSLARNPWLLGPRPTLADMATLTFVRQFAMVDKPWFDAQPWPCLARWLAAFLASGRFTAIMTKYPQWHPGDSATLFPPPSSSF
ncbi:MAG: glutathione S-transferase [Confluentimicrobium sp.]|uniref:glutathione S-transferase n=1 Tax=Actibacterium sp. TaxID=1872125 RepID=UPI000C68BF9A|nr:glutathione S-transferase [Actibacterium sp.]MBC57409.1 glutathione S-transferase [Actibacterium sp.]